MQQFVMKSTGFIFLIISFVTYNFCFWIWSISVVEPDKENNDFSKSERMYKNITYLIMHKCFLLKVMMWDSTTKLHLLMSRRLAV